MIAGVIWEFSHADVLLNFSRNNKVDGLDAVPITFVVGSGTVLPGLEEGIIGMKRGSIRRIIVPSEVGYGKYPGLEPKPTSALGESISIIEGAGVLTIAPPSRSAST